MKEFNVPFWPFHFQVRWCSIFKKYTNNTIALLYIDINNKSDRNAPLFSSQSSKIYTAKQFEPLRRLLYFNEKHNLYIEISG